MLWTLHELQHVLGLPVAGEDIAVNGVSIDSRTLQPGDLFVALAGTPSGGFTTDFATDRDGHDYVPQAVAAGAAALLVNRPVEVTVPQLQVKDTLLDGLWRLGEAGRDRSSATRIAITGSYGKTTAKALLHLLLGGHVAEKSNNNCWGVPLTLARLPQDAKTGIFEIGIDKPGEMQRLTALVQPHVAVVTYVGPAHMESLGDLNGVAREKLAIQEGLAANGPVIVPLTVAQQWPELLTHPVLTFDVNDSAATTFIETVTPLGEKLAVKAQVAGVPVAFMFPAMGRHLLSNALAALTAAHAVGVDVASVADRLDDFALLAGRGGTVEVGGVMVIDDSYNGQPVAMQAALKSLAASSAKRKFALLGDMLELGPTEKEQHAALVSLCNKLDGVWAVGPLMQAVHAALPADKQKGWVAEAPALDVAAMAARLQPGDAVLVKGSKKVLYVHGMVKKLQVALAGERVL